MGTTPGMWAVGTNAEEPNTSGNTQVKPTDWATSGLRTEIPTNALIQENTPLFSAHPSRLRSNRSRLNCFHSSHNAGTRCCHQA
jgi:hypothetical protein